MQKKGLLPKMYTNRKRPVISKDQGLFQCHFINGQSNYLSSTSAPASSSCFLSASASSLDTPSFTALGALSTISFASLSPRPVNSLTSFTTASLEPPAAVRTTSNSDFSSATLPPSPAAGPAIATAAAAGSIPYSSLRIPASSLTSFHS